MQIARMRLSVVETIKTSPGTEVKAGDTIDIRRNVTDYRDCVYRQGERTTGASFPADQYTPSDPDALQQKALSSSSKKETTSSSWRQTSDVNQVR